MIGKSLRIHNMGIHHIGIHLGSAAHLPTAALLAGALAPAWVAPAAAAWPEDRPIEIIVGFAAGGGTDILARRMAPALTKQLGDKANFVVINRPGAAGEIALTALSRSAPNGYTIGVISAPSFITIPLQKKPQYDPAAIVPLARVVEDPTVIVVGKDSPYKTLRDLVAALKRSPKSVSIGNNGIGTNGHMASLALQVAGDVQVNLIPFKGTSDSRTALLGGHVDAIAMGVSEFITDKAATDKLRVLVQLGAERSRSLPNVATAKEEGLDVVIASERGFAAPKDLPPEIAERLEKAIAAAVTEPEFLQSATSDELSVSYLTGPDWTKRLADQRGYFERIWRASEHK